MTSVILDTHTLIWLVGDEKRLFRQARSAIDKADKLLVADITLREIGIAQNFHGDPADEFIAATAIVLGKVVVTIDEKMRKSPAVPAIW